MRYKYLQIFQTHETMKSSNFDFFQTIVKQKPVEGNYIVNLVLRRSCLWLNLVWFILQDKLCARGWRGHFPRVSSSLAGIALIFVRKFGVGLLTSLTLPSTPAITLNIWLMLLSAILLPFMRLDFCTFIYILWNKCQWSYAFVSSRSHFRSLESLHQHVLHVTQRTKLAQ